MQRSAGTVRRIALFAVTPLVGGMLLIACHGRDAQLGKTGEPGGDGVSEEMASVSMALVNVPNDALCLELSIFPTTGTWGGRTQLFDITPGSSPTLTLNGLPSGNASLGARSFGVPCSQVTSSTSPTWITAGPVPVTLVAGQPVSTSVVLLRPGYVQVTATFNDGTPTITPSTKDFGAVQVGGTASATFSVTNPGTAALALTAPAFTGTDASQFQVLQNGCGTSLAAGSTCAINISFKPTAAGNKTANLSMGSVSASLSGSAFASVLTISPSPANFPSTPVGNTASLTLTLTNGSTAAVSLGSWSITGGSEFGYGATTCGASLAAAASCTQVINFVPVSAGSKTATLSSSAGASVTLNGTATSPSVAYRINCGSSTAVSPFTADQYFSGGTQSSYSKTITVSGVANAAPAAVYQTERYGNSTYTFPGLTASSSYTVRLHFAELYWTAAGKRLFNVTINGAAVLSRLDLYATIGSQYKAYVRDFTATANSSGQIVVAFTSVTDNATISGIEIVAATDPCSGVTCNGHGTCSGAGVCTCTGGWSGPGCTVDPCSGVTCNSHGSCSGAGVCTCTGGWSGSGCTIDPCAGMTCSGHGSCSAGTCTCNQGWSGPTCAIAAPPTLSGPNDITMCGGDSTPSVAFTVSASGAGGGPYQYQWSKVDDLSGSNPTTSWSGLEGDGTTATMTQDLGYRGCPMPPSKSYYRVQVVDPKNGGSATSSIATLWLARPDPFYITYHRDNDWPNLSVQIDVPTTGCINVQFSTNGGSSFSPVRSVCAGETNPQWVVVGTINTSNYSLNIVRTTTQIQAGGLACLSYPADWIYTGP